MPIYEYKCQKCGHKFEELVFGERKIKCPKCGSISSEKLFSTFSTGKKSDSLDKDSNGCSNGTCNINCPTCGL